MSERPKVLVICGPTATGKTAAAVEAALMLDGEVVSADSMQIYRGMDIGTAKPTEAEKKGVPHHMIDILDPSESYSAARYKEDAYAVINDIISRGKTPILAGGTGQYISAVTENLAYGDVPENAELRARLNAEAAEKGGAAMLSRLAAVDPDAAAKLHENDLRRIVRALEIYELTGVTRTEFDRRSRLAPPLYDFAVFGLNYGERADLYERIDARVDKMLEEGLLSEAKGFYGKPLSHTAAQAIGYKELFEYFDGKTDLDTAVENIKRGSRRYAKRQLTWFSPMDVRWYDMKNASPRLAAEDMAKRFKAGE